MTFAIITSTPHKKIDNCIYAYAPYVHEMNLWLKYVDAVEIVGPLSNEKRSNIDTAYCHDKIKFNKIPEIEFTTILQTIVSFLKLPTILLSIFTTCKKANHIHLRCPGNIGLLGCFVQILFPKKIKTAKYAGNWDPKSKQPFSYRIQKWILSNTFLTKNIQVLVYGEWLGQTNNINPFFTATYRESEKEEIEIRNINEKMNLLFVGKLSRGKQPLLSVKVVNELRKLGYKVYLDIYGEGEEQIKIEQFISNHNLKEYVRLHGNKDKQTIKEAYQIAQFLVFISKSEGWPKVVAEAMFWKCLPISTKVSCIPEMLDNGERGSIVAPSLDEITNEITFYIKNPSIYNAKIQRAFDWSRTYTLDKFEEKIKNVIIAR
jgi:glycosyltransferase involved in cell wall biosynthesis